MRHRDNVVVLAHRREAAELRVVLESPRKSPVVKRLDHLREIGTASGSLADQLIEEITFRHCDKQYRVAIEARRTDDEAAAIAAERIRNGAADHEEDGVEALRKLGIELL